MTYRPVRVSNKTTWSFMEVETDDGLTGIGEATLFRGSHDFAALANALSDRMRGKPFSYLESNEMAPPEEDIASWAVISAIEQAGWDILGKRIGQPVHQLLGQTVKSRVPLYANVNRRTVDRSPAGFAESIRRARRAGFEIFKIAPFDGVSEEPSAECALFQAGLDRIRGASEAVDRRGNLYVDCHWRLSPEQADTLLGFASEFGLGWIECPMPERSDALDEIRTFRHACAGEGVLIAGGERGTHPGYFQRLLDEGLYDIIMPDVKYVGGLRNCVAVAELAKGHDVKASLHNPSGPVSHLASLHATAVSENFSTLEHQFDEAPLFWELSRSALPTISEGCSGLPQGIGLGFDTTASLTPGVLDTERAQREAQDA